jgi:integrase
MVSQKWINSRFPGVRFREHPERKHGIKPDRYFTIRFQHQGKRTEEGLGWASEGWSEIRAADELAKLRNAARTGEGPQRLQEKRQIQEEQRNEVLAEQQEEERKAITFSQFFLGTYFPNSITHKKVSTNRREKGIFHKYLEPEIGDSRLTDISPLCLERVVKRMKNADQSPRSIQYCLAIIRQVFNFAIHTSTFTGSNPVSKVRKPKFDNRRMRFLNFEEAHLLLEAIKARSEATHDIALLSLYCGLRAGEIFSLTWDCVDLESERIHVRDTKSNRDRFVGIPALAKEMLTKREKSEARKLVFTTREGRQIERVSNAFLRAVKDAGLNGGVTDPKDKVVFHSLRHTYASWLVQGGVDLYTVKELMGHSSILMTERYSHESPDRLLRAANVLSNKGKRAQNHLGSRLGMYK